MPRLTRRAFVGSVLTVMAGLKAPAAFARRRPITVLTSYPDTVIARFQDAFERAHPQYRLDVQWRMPFDALPYLERPQQSGIDVYWAPSTRNFAALKARGALRKLDIDLDGLPARIGHTQLVDPDGHYVATEMAGYGFVLSPQALEAARAPMPADWSDLAAPVYAGHIALPDPVSVGFAPVMIDIVLQAWGWERGWALWSEIAGNAKLVRRGDDFITDQVAPGKLAVGLTIDFFAASAIANGAPLTFTYPTHTGINPAQVGITASASNLEGARQFVQFLVSATGQKILADPAVRKLPVRPSVYGQLPACYYDPFKAAARGGLDYDEQRDLARMGLVTALFGTMLSQPHDELVGLWRRVHAAERSGIDCAKVRALLCQPPVTAAEAASKDLQGQFGRLRAGARTPLSRGVEKRWAARCADWRREAGERLKALGA